MSCERFCDGAASVNRRLCVDGPDPDFGELLAVAVFHAIAFAAFLFENDHFIALDVAEHIHGNAGTFQVWRTDLYNPVVVDQVYVAEGDRISYIRCQPVDEDLLTFLDFKLLTGDGNNCKHVDNQKISENKNSPFSKGVQRYDTCARCTSYFLKFRKNPPVIA
jgi:hypothetical protein